MSPVVCFLLGSSSYLHQYILLRSLCWQLLARSQVQVMDRGPWGAFWRSTHNTVCCHHYSCLFQETNKWKKNYKVMPQTDYQTSSLCHCGVGLCGLLTISFVKLASLCVSLSPCAKPLKLCPQSSHFTARSSPFYSPSHYLHLAPPTWQIMLFHFGHFRRGGCLICFQNHCNAKNPLLRLLFVMPCKHYI